MIKEENDEIIQRERHKVNRNAIISVVLAMILVGIFFLGYFARGLTEPDSAQKINEMMRLLDGVSVYTGDKTADDYAKSLVDLIKKEDPYAAYYSPEEYKRLLAEDGGSYFGVGIGFLSDYTVGKVYNNSPAYKAEILVGDALVSGVFKGDETADDGNKKFTVFAEKLAEKNADKADKDKKTLFDTYGEFFRQFNNEEEITVKILRGEETIEKTLYKTNYTVSYVEYFDNEKGFYFSTEKNEETDKDEFKGRTRDLNAENESDKRFIAISDDTAYIRLYEFEGDAAEQFGEAINYMRERNRTKLILDLRDNGGGLIDVLLKVASYIVNNNNEPNINILAVQERTALKYESTFANKFYSGLTDISVIANGNTASASECLIGALSDYGVVNEYHGANFSLDRLILTQYNEKRETYCTFGKGIRQTTYGLKSGGAFKFTTAYIFWPISGIFIHGKGIETGVAENRVSDDKAIERANAVLHNEE